MRGYLLLVLFGVGIAFSALANTPPTPIGAPGALCEQAIAVAEQGHAIPRRLLAAIGRVESGRRDPVSGSYAPWPWTVDADGSGYFYESKAQAIAAVRQFQASGIRSIDVGCMQVNLMHHPDAFASLEQAFDPAANADYAARFLRQLYAQTNDWGQAAAEYHSATPALAEDYRRKVMTAWGQAPVGPGTPGVPPMAAAWAATLGSPFGAVRSFGFNVPRRGMPSPMVIRSAPGAAPGRNLAAYRSMPILIASRVRAGGEPHMR